MIWSGGAPTTLEGGHLPSGVSNVGCNWGGGGGLVYCIMMGEGGWVHGWVLAVHKSLMSGDV